MMMVNLTTKMSGITDFGVKRKYIKCKMQNAKCN